MYTALTLRSACSHSSYRLPMCGVEGQSPTRSLGGLDLKELHTLRNVSAVYMASP